MLKESILFVVATGALVFFFTPSEEPSKPVVVEEKVEKTVAPSTKISNDSWDYEDEEDGDDAFAFGEPVGNPDGDDGEDSWTENDSSEQQVQSNNARPKSTSFASNRTKPLAGSPKPGEPGSIENPIDFETSSPPDTDDD